MAIEVDRWSQSDGVGLADFGLDELDRVFALRREGSQVREREGYLAEKLRLDKLDAARGCLELKYHENRRKTKVVVLCCGVGVGVF